MKNYNELTGIASVQPLGITGSATAVVYTCPYCNAKVNLAVNNAKTVICPVCGKEFRTDKDIAEELIDKHMAVDKDQDK